jgi:predicted amidohydrolase
VELVRNTAAAANIAAETARNGVYFIVMPEAAVSNYIYRDLTQFVPYIDTALGNTTGTLITATREHNC